MSQPLLLCATNIFLVVSVKPDLYTFTLINLNFYDHNDHNFKKWFKALKHESKQDSVFGVIFTLLCVSFNNDRIIVFFRHKASFLFTQSRKYLWGYHPVIPLVHLLGDLHSHPHLQPRAAAVDPRNPIVARRGWVEPPPTSVCDYGTRRLVVQEVLRVEALFGLFQFY